MGEILKKVALNDIHEKLGAKMVPFAGYNMPVRYSSDMEEHKTVRNGVGIFDVSHMGEFLLKGPKAIELIQKVSSNDVTKLADGQAQYSCLPNENGGIVDDLLVYRNNEEEYVLVVNASNIDKDWDWISSQNSMGVEMTNISDSLSLFAVQGPKAIATLQKLTATNLMEVNFYTFTIGEFAGCNDVVMSATGYTGAGGFEIYVKNEDAVKVWNAIMEAGDEFDIAPIGLGARDTLRLEMGYCLYGNDIDDTTSPLEAGLGWVTKFTKEFINSKNLLKQKEEGVTRRLVGFKMIDRGIPRHGYEIEDAEGNTIGKVTSGTMSPSMGVGIGMGYINRPHTKPTTEVFIVVRNKKLRAIVEKLPLLK
ncbi:MAG: glycine cleavage system aminomethyltransferase GcvT [Cyclobacteriaceae bacterium]|nr:glycine cleavage system aminomethyltransferase GcvT [Cyclobacteriaceae bacterium]